MEAIIGCVSKCVINSGVILLRCLCLLDIFIYFFFFVLVAFVLRVEDVRMKQISNHSASCNLKSSFVPSLSISLFSEKLSKCPFNFLERCKRTGKFSL